MCKISSLENLGLKCEFWLNSVGVDSKKELNKLGAVEVYKRVKLSFPDEVNLNLLYALYGAIHSIKWNNIPSEIKNDLKKQILSIS